MKKIFFIMSCLLTIACNSDSDDGPNQEELDSSTPINILLLPKAASYDEPTPRMVAETDGWNIVELTNPESPETMILHFLNQKERNSHVMILTDSTALITTCTSSFSPNKKAILAALTSDGMKAALCNVNWNSGTYSIESETTISNTTTRAAGYHDLDFAKESMFKMLDKLGERIDNLNNWAGYLGTESSAVAEVWTNLVIPVAKYQLYSNDPEKLAEIKGEYIKSNTESILLNLMPSSVQRAWYGAHLATNYISDLWPYVESKIPEKEIPDYTNDNNLHYWVRNLSDIARWSVPLQETYEKTKPKYIVTISGPYNITETEATVEGRFELNEGNAVGIVNMGYIVTFPSGYERTVDAWNLPETTIKDLQPGTRYKVCAFVKTPFERYCSEAKEFVTDGLLEISPTELAFESTGGSKGVVVTVGNRMTWDITDKPDWCSITKGNGTFFVDVRSTEEARSGAITITATLANGKTKTGTVSVSQEGEMNISLPDIGSMIIFNGNGTIKETKTENNGKPVETTMDSGGMTMLTSKDGKLVLTCMCCPYVLFNEWIVGSIPPENADGLAYRSFTQSATSDNITIECSYNVHSGKNPNWGDNILGTSWEETSLTMKIEISSLKSNTPKLNATFKHTHKWHKDYYAYLVGPADYTEVISGQFDLTGEKLF